ncbi:hypothetical protein N3K66_001998 [Trichothecium roseum]|uniref:Uncharacterized protein n=1 Tax=Trichothecium roseum TaxID=47278 RepID=A0ACC0V9S9_9HYPO|nr:hypothetical protein N3K66_001998 [Trichothecium roseum]
MSNGNMRRETLFIVLTHGLVATLSNSKDINERPTSRGSSRSGERTPVVDDDDDDDGRPTMADYRQAEATVAEAKRQAELAESDLRDAKAHTFEAERRWLEADDEGQKARLRPYVRQARDCERQLENMRLVALRKLIEAEANLYHARLARERGLR